MEEHTEEEWGQILRALIEAQQIVIENVRKIATGDDPFTIDEAAAYLRVSTSTLYKYMKEGEIVSVESTEGSRRMILRKEIDAFIARHRRKA